MTDFVLCDFCSDSPFMHFTKLNKFGVLQSRLCCQDCSKSRRYIFRKEGYDEALIDEKAIYPQKTSGRQRRAL